ncbi:hypothetical protein NLK61_26925 [Pseudomonas fuscovaginae UPB0736]|uniref:Uncharacterized protein n=1 Tax=Pseudomonas asplenii TaxID=53407 RepID=A0A1H6P6G9_9PSED|nr:hypothetical protein [Pseudomonas fuscovaginae]UUQ64785.1 hypothetical protein NLK61_26925 [Pseudomonas fuscovaginae UPB0736]SEI20697.1 hypothetical protein SAMN05216581_4290 [Pseudomonas fuscovaginae]
MSLRKSTAIISLLIAGSLVAALSSTTVLASADQSTPPKPKCTNQQFWNPKTNKCEPLVSQRAIEHPQASDV